MSDQPTTQMPCQSTSDDAGAGALRCQWCSVPLAAGVTTCPTCGSPGIPDPRMTVAGLNDLATGQPEPLSNTMAVSDITGDEVELTEWWRNEPSAGDLNETPLQTLNFEDIERRRMQSIGFIVGAVVVCTFLGWLIGPSLIVKPFEGLTGTTVENLDDLRTMGAIGGMIAGMFVGATGGWVIWSSR